MINRRLQQIVIFTVLCLTLVSCVRPPVFKADGYALIKSNYPVVAINGVDIEKSYQLDLEAGENSLRVIYNTYQQNYLCTFSWTAVADTTYEITDQENQYPLTLYRWYRRNALWALRLDPLDPLQCSQAQ